MAYVDLEKNKGNSFSILGVIRTFIGVYNHTSHLKCGCRPREVEWLTTFLIFSWGFFLLLPGDTYANSGSFLPPFSNETLWGLVAILLSVVRCAALIINGHWRRSPLLRMILSALAASFWAAEGSWMLNESMTFVPQTFAFYPILVVAEFMAIQRSAKDYVANLGM